MKTRGKVKEFVAEAIEQAMRVKEDEGRDERTDGESIRYRTRCSRARERARA